MLNQIESNKACLKSLGDKEGIIHEAHTWFHENFGPYSTNLGFIYPLFVIFFFLLVMNNEKLKKY